MKRMIILGAMLALLLVLCGCSEPETFSPEEQNVFRYDPDTVVLSTPKNADGAVTGGDTEMQLPEEYIYYSDIMEDVGETGLIVAGYATGMRESHPKISHTLTDFVVTDIYYGTPSSSTITVEENFELVNDNGVVFFHCVGTKRAMLRNDVKVLLFLKLLDNGNYYMLYDYIPLMPDYNEYNDTYLQSVLDFFRGDRSVYFSDGPWKEVDSNYPYPFYISYHLAFWPEKDISDEALLAEMSDHLLLRTATEYEIAIWPFGHKNYTLNSVAPLNFMRVSIPMEEYF